jgi:hypothetical protein
LNVAKERRSEAAKKRKSEEMKRRKSKAARDELSWLGVLYCALSLLHHFHDCY